MSTSILSISFFVFLFINLYRGVKLKETLGSFKSRLAVTKPNLKFNTLGGKEFTELIFLEDAEGCVGVFVTLLVWVLVALIFIFVIFILGAVAWYGFLIFTAMLYWVFFRMLRLVFKSRNVCYKNWKKSLLYAFFYTIFYTIWIYNVILGAHYLVSFC